MVSFCAQIFKFLLIILPVLNEWINVIEPVPRSYTFHSMMNNVVIIKVVIGQKQQLMQGTWVAVLGEISVQ